MKRRTFNKLFLAGTGSAVIADVSCAQKVDQKPVHKSNRMYVGCQRGEVNEESCAFRARHGVFNIDGGSPKIIDGVGWDLDDSLRKRELCEKYGISVDAYHLPLTSAGIDRQIFPNIMLGRSPERDREIEQIQQMISVAGKRESEPFFTTRPFFRCSVPDEHRAVAVRCTALGITMKQSVEMKV